MPGPSSCSGDDYGHVRRAIRPPAAQRVSRARSGSRAADKSWIVQGRIHVVTFKRVGGVMQIRGMLGNRAVNLIVVKNQWLDILDLATGSEVASFDLHQDMRVDGDLLSVGGLSIVVDRSFIFEAQALVDLASVAQRKSESPRDLQARYCSQCGSPTDPTGPFCSSCGIPLESKGTQASLSSSDKDFIVGTSLTRQRFTPENGIWREPSSSRLRQVYTTGKGRLSISIALIVAVVAAVGISMSQEDGGNNARARDVTFNTACATLSTYAFDGIPATYLDEGAQLLEQLAEDFDDLGRDDLADRLRHVVDQTYDGSAGQVAAKESLIQLASAQCGSGVSVESMAPSAPLTTEELLEETQSSLEVEVGRYTSIDTIKTYGVFKGCGEYQYFAFIEGTGILWILEYVPEAFDEPLAPDSYRYWDEVTRWDSSHSSEFVTIEQVSLTGSSVSGFLIRYRSDFDEQTYGLVLSAISPDTSTDRCFWVESTFIQELQMEGGVLVGQSSGESKSFSYDPLTGSISEE